MKAGAVDDKREAILERLAAGESLAAICRSEDMPDRRTVQRWQDDDADWDAAVTRAREHGYHLLADKALHDAEHCDDASKARLLFDARRWYLGKLSNAFSDDKTRKHELAGPNGGAIQVTEIVLRGVKADEG